MQLGTNRPKYETLFPFQFAFGSAGTGTSPVQFNRGTAVAVDPGGDYLYVTDDVTGTVTVTDLDGTFIRRIGQGTPGGIFIADSYGIDVAPNGNVYVNDHANQVVRVYAPGGASFIRTIGAPGGFPAAAGTLFQPPHIAVDNVGDVYVADIGSQTTGFPLGARIQKWSAAGVYQGMFKFSTTESIVGLAADKTNGNVWTIRGTTGLTQYDPAGAQVSAFLDNTIANADFVYLDDVMPDRIFVVSAGVYLHTPGENGVSVYSPNGAIYGKFATTYGAAEGQFFYPDCARTYGTRIYVMDYEAARVSVLHNVVAGAFA